MFLVYLSNTSVVVVVVVVVVVALSPIECRLCGTLRRERTRCPRRKKGGAGGLAHDK